MESLYFYVKFFKLGIERLLDQSRRKNSLQRILMVQIHKQKSISGININVKPKRAN